MLVLGHEKGTLFKELLFLLMYSKFLINNLFLFENVFLFNRDPNEVLSI